jgi:hypothetical protein
MFLQFQSAELFQFLLEMVVQQFLETQTVTMDQTVHLVQTDSHSIVLHTAEAEEDTVTELVTMETLEAWELVWVIKTAEAQAEAEALEEIGNTEQQAEAEALEALQDLEETLLQVTVQVLQDTKVDLVGDQEHLVEHQELTTAGLHGLELAALAELVNMELQAEAAEAEEQAEEALVAEEQVAHQQLITQVVKVETELDLAAEEIAIAMEMVQREVLA